MLVPIVPVANSYWPLLFHGTGRSLQYFLRTLLKKFMPETSAYCVGMIAQTHTFIDNLRLAIRMVQADRIDKSIM